MDSLNLKLTENHRAMSKPDQTTPPSKRWGNNKRWTKQDDARRIILNAAIGCFEKKGVKSTTIEEIAKAASITRRTIYHYFKSKNEILQAAAEQHGFDVIHRMNNEICSTQPFADYALNCITWMIEKMHEEPFYKLQVSNSVGLQVSYFHFTNPQVYQAWQEVFQEPYIEALRLRTINPEFSLRDILTWIGRIVLSYLQYPTAPANSEQIKREIGCFFVNALKYGT